MRLSALLPNGYLKKKKALLCFPPLVSTLTPPRAASSLSLAHLQQFASLLLWIITHLITTAHSQRPLSGPPALHRRGGSWAGARY